LLYTQLKLDNRQELSAMPQESNTSAGDTDGQQVDEGAEENPTLIVNIDNDRYTSELDQLFSVPDE
jgi:hypothetical protein